jgi:hypothetical protein
MNGIETKLLAAFDAAERVGLCPRDCYLAAIAVWRGHRPGDPPQLARQSAVRIVIDQRRTKFFETLRRERTALPRPPRRLREPGSPVLG